MGNTYKKLLSLVCILVLLVCGVAACKSEPAASTTMATEPAQELPLEIYWNLDRALYDGMSEAGMSSRMPESDGYFHIRMFRDGQTLDLKASDRRVINHLDTLDMMGLVFENGIVVDVIPVEDMPMEKVGWQFYVQSVGGNLVKVNSANTMKGMEVILELNDDSKIYDMSGVDGELGKEVTPTVGDRVYPIVDLDGNVKTIFVYKRDNFVKEVPGECIHCKTAVSWKLWDKPDRLPTESGHYQLQNDVQLKNQLSLPEDCKMCLNLNGKVIDGKEGQRVISMHNAGDELAIMDTSEGQKGAIRSHGELAGQGGVMYVRFGAFYLYGGTLDGSDSVNTYAGALMCINKGAYAYINGGTIKGGTAKYSLDANGKPGNGMGGNIRVLGKLVINDGLITGGRALAHSTRKNGKTTYSRGYGGNIYMGTGGTLEMHGGKVANGVAGGMGGNIYIDGVCDMTMTGGVIGSGKLTTADRNGGNLFVGGKATFTMSGGIIRNGQVYNGGANVYANGKVTISGGQIYGGKVIDKATGAEKNAVNNNLYVVNGDLRISGGKISGGVTVTDSSTTDNQKASLRLSGNAYIYGAAEGRTNLTLSSSGEKVLIKVGTLGKNAKIGISTTRGVFTQPRDEAELEHFISDITGAEVVYFDGAYALGKVSCLCGKQTHTGSCDGVERLWSPWNTAGKLPATTGNYYITEPLEITAQSNVGADQKVVLDLNGQSVTGSIPRIYAVSAAGAALTITDTMGGGSIKNVNTNGDLGGIVLVRTGTEFTLLEGTLDASEYNSANTNGGGAIFVNTGAAFTMAGGTIQGGTAPVGGAVVVAKNGVMRLTGGSIVGGNAGTGKGGNISSLGTFEMTGGSVTGGKAQYGGNIYTEGSVTISGGTIEGGSGSTPNLHVINGELTLSGGKIAGGVMVDDRAADDGIQTVLRLSGKPVVTGAKTNLELSDRGDGVTVYVENMEKDAKVGITAQSGVFTQPCAEANAQYFTGDKEGVNVVWHEGALALGKLSCLCGKQEHLPTCDQQTHFWLPWTGKNLPTATGYYYLTAPHTVSLSSELAKDQKVVLDLNGQAVTGSVARIYSVASAGAELTITDTVGSGSLKNTNSSGDLGGIVLVRTDAKLTLLGGTLDASDFYCTNNNGGAAVFVNTGASFTMADGAIKGGAVKSGNGGAVVIAKGGAMRITGGSVSGGKAEAGKGGNISVLGSLEMTGGSVTGGKAQYGGNIYVEGTMTLTGGSVTGGTGNTRNILVLNGQIDISGGTMDGGVTIDDRTAGDNIHTTLRISGNPVIFGATQNLNLATRGDGATVYVGAMTEGAKVSVTGQPGYFSQPCAEGSEAYFLSDSKLTDVVWHDGALALGKAGCVCGKATHLAGCDRASHLWMPWDPTGTTLPASTGYYYLTDDMSVDSTTLLGADQHVVLDLNGKTVTRENGRIYSTDVAGSKLTITDRSGNNGTLRITGQSGDSGLGVYVRNGDFTLFGGIIDASAAKTTNPSQGGIAVWINKGRTFKMYGGTIKGGTTTSNNGGAIEISSTATMELHDGFIYGTNADTQALNGTAINVAGTLKLLDGTVTGGTTAGVGGTICVKGVMEMSGGTVTGGKTTGNGGNIYVTDTGNLTMSGGLVEKGTATYGKNIYVDGNLIMSGGTVQSGNILVLDGTMTLTGGKVLGGLSVDDRSATDSNHTLLTISGSPEVAGMTLVNRGATCKLLVGELTISKPIPISAPAGIFATVKDGVDANKAAACFVSKDDATRVSRQADGLHMVDSSAVIHCLCGQKTHTPGCDGIEYLWKPWAKTNTTLPTATGYWYLEDTMTLTDSVSLAADQKVVLDLNGKTATRNNGRIYSVHNTGSSLVVTDSSANGNGTLKVTGTSGNSGLGIYVRGGNATWIRGILDASEATTTHTSQGGTAIWINVDRTFTLYDGTIKGGVPTKCNNGGTIEVSSGGAMEMHGGTVVGCNAPNNSINGTAINNTGSFKMYDGTVQGGTTKGVGGAICARGVTEIHGGTITDGTSGNGKSIYGNGSSDVKILGGQIGDVNIAGKLKLSGAPSIATLTIAADKLTVGALTKGALITVTGTGVIAKNVETDVSAYFKAADATQKVVYNAAEKTLTVQ